MSLTAVLVGSLVVVLGGAVLMVWGLCMMAGQDDEDMARMRAAHVQQQMRDRVLAKLGEDDDAA